MKKKRQKIDDGKWNEMKSNEIIKLDCKKPIKKSVVIYVLFIIIISFTTKIRENFQVFLYL